jgi:hypothetical protein
MHVTIFNIIAIKINIYEVSKSFRYAENNTLNEHIKDSSVGMEAYGHI